LTIAIQDGFRAYHKVQSNKDIMTILANKRQILEILVDNLSNPQPQVVNSQLIAEKLNMSLKETCQLIKIMHQMGVVISDMEGQKSLITRKGLLCVNQ
jgi:predicted transcriptional regulator